MRKYKEKSNQLSSATTTKKQTPPYGQILVNLGESGHDFSEPVRNRLGNISDAGPSTLTVVALQWTFSLIP